MCYLILILLLSPYHIDCITGYSLDATQHFHILETLRDNPFWWDVENHRLVNSLTSDNFGFNQIIGLPKNGGWEKPLFDFEKMIVYNLSSTKHMAFKKATGLGISELLRYMGWLCVKDVRLRRSQMCNVTGPCYYSYRMLTLQD